MLLISLSWPVLQDDDYDRGLSAGLTIADKDYRTP
jgi:hypothetical protein